ncbi:MAG TPA: hypothetical protein VGP37_11495 [Candidatus Nanopelagicales bacterium]|nr:hypothetical protein [Candidatus Nanopelagicales bacterium]
MSGSGASVHHHPAWFGVVMGTGALSLVATAQSETWDASWLEVLAAALLILATLAALVLWPRYLRRLTDRDKLAAELSDPGHGAMLATFPAGLLVLAVAWGRVGPFLVGSDIALIVDAVLLVVGASIATVVSAWWATSIGRSGVGLEGVNGGWLIPPVMNLIVPLAIVPLITANPAHAPWLVPLALAFWGIGALLFLALLAILVARLAFRDPIAAPMAPSLWIPLAPAGVLGLALLRVLEAGAQTGVLPAEAIALGIVVSAAGIGFGLWWALFAWFDLMRARRTGVPFHPGWWGFVFPLAAMSLSTSAVGIVMGAEPIEIAGTAIALITTFVWAVVAVRTVRILISARESVSR